LREAARPAGALAYGALKRLEIARALASEPKVLLLDEPAAGCNPVETRKLEGIIRSVVADGVTVVLVEHDKRDAAPGVDGLTWQDYEADLDRKIEDLHARVHRGAYRALPSRRLWGERG
jgi:ABC-type Mn2+/Zn2+ transport system ATPase subunit